MTSYIVRRILMLFPVLLVASVLSFCMLKFIPGDPARTMAGMEASEEDIARMRAEMGLDQPLHVQFGKFIGRVVTGDLGRSLRTHRMVSLELKTRLKNTVQLAVVAIVLAGAVGVFMGILAATHHRTMWDSLAMTFAMVGVSTPVFWVGLMLILVFSVGLGVLPTSGAGTPQHLILPALTLGLNSAASIARMTRSSMLEVLNQDYVRTARAKGLAERVVVWRHALKNALIPVITVLGIQFGHLLSGAAITETVFAWPGIGRLLVESIGNRDYPVIQAGVLLVAVLFVLNNLVVDLSYAWVDRRIQYD